VAQLFSLGIMALPPEYVSYFAGDGRKEGGLTVEPGWFQLWPPDEVEHWNRDYHVSEFAPGFLGFGSSGGGEMLAFDTDGRVVMIPMVGMSPDDAKPVADSWSEFIERIER
jgi:hypothetical protein